MILARHEILTEADATKAAELQQLHQRDGEQHSVMKIKNAEIKPLNQALKTANSTVNKT